MTARTAPNDDAFDAAAYDQDIRARADAIINKKIAAGEVLHCDWIAKELADGLGVASAHNILEHGARLYWRQVVHEQLLQRTDYPRQVNPIMWERIEEPWCDEDVLAYIDMVIPWLSTDEIYRLAGILRAHAETQRQHVDALRRYANITKQSERTKHRDRAHDDESSIGE